MNFETVVVIYIVKNNLAIDAKIGKWKNKFCHNNSDYQWSRSAIEKIMRDAITDYLIHCNDIKREVKRYFLYRDDFFVYNEFDAMKQFIHLIQVRDNDEYVNGFNEELWTKAMESIKDI